MMDFREFSDGNSLKPASLRKHLLEQELDDLNDLLLEFESCTGGERVAATLPDDPNNLVVILQNFPLPDKYKPIDYANMLLDLEHYPQSPPNGLWLMPRSNPKTIRHLQSYFAHTYEDPEMSGEPRHKWEGYTWICYHYRRRRWDFNPRDFRSGDNLCKFVEAFFNALQDS